MKKKYKLVRVPEEAWLGFNRKKVVMENILKEELRRNKKVTLADTLRYFSNKKIYIYNDEVVNFFKNKKIKKVKSNII